MAFQGIEFTPEMRKMVVNAKHFFDSIKNNPESLKMPAYSTGKWPPIVQHVGHPIHGMLASHCTSCWPLIPRHVGQPVYGMLAT